MRTKSWLIALAALSVAGAAQAVPERVPVQAYITTAAGLPYEATSTFVQLSFFASQEAVQPLVVLPEVEAGIQDGVLTMGVATDALGDAVGPATESLWMEVKIDQTTLAGRQEVGSVFFARACGDSQSLGGVPASGYVQGSALGAYALKSDVAGKVDRAGDTLTGPLSVAAAGPQLTLGAAGSHGGNLLLKGAGGGDLTWGLANEASSFSLLASDAPALTLHPDLSADFYGTLRATQTVAGAAAAQLFGPVAGLGLTSTQLDGATWWVVSHDSGKFAIRGTADDLASGEDRFVIRPDGRVGFGTFDPEAELTVVDDDESANLLLQQVGGHYARFGADAGGAEVFSSWQIDFLTDGGASKPLVLAGNSVVVRGDAVVNWDPAPNVPPGYLSVRTGDADRPAIVTSGNHDYGSEGATHFAQWGANGWQRSATFDAYAGPGSSLGPVAEFPGKLKAASVEQVSDARLKHRIQPIAGALERVRALRGVTFEWIDTARGVGRQLGFIAQEVERVLPELVSTAADGFKSVAYMSLVAVLAEALEEEDAKVRALEARVQRLEAAVEALQSGRSGFAAVARPEASR